MGNSKLHKLREKLMEELEGHANEKPLDTASMEAIYKLTESVKALDTICAMDEYGDKDEGNSYARHRDSMGRYSGYAYQSYDGAREHLIHKLSGMMADAPDERSRHVIQNAISELDR